jgi:hypothetical protein
MQFPISMLWLTRILARLFYILALFRKILTSAPFLERFQKMDPELGAMDRGAEV